MTDERLCARCGLPQPIHQHGQGRHGHPFEAAPSTDEGEVLGLTEAQMHAEADKRYKLPREGGTYSGNEALRQRWAFVNGAKWGAAEARAPLEERIRNLQRWAEIDHANLAAAEAEVERLREALRMVRVRLAAGWVANPAVEDVASELIWTTLGPPSRSSEEAGNGNG